VLCPAVSQHTKKIGGTIVWLYSDRSQPQSPIHDNFVDRRLCRPFSQSEMCLSPFHPKPRVHSLPLLQNQPNKYFARPVFFKNFPGLFQFFFQADFSSTVWTGIGIGCLVVFLLHTCVCIFQLGEIFSTFNFSCNFFQNGSGYTLPCRLKFNY